MPCQRGRRAAVFLLLGLLVVVAVPLAVALVAVLDPTPHPLGEVAETEMRVRDVTTGHPPLVGLPGRIGELARQGSHPGPMSFYALWPTYRLLGQSAGALTAAGVVVHLAAIGVALWLAARRGGVPMALGVALLLSVLVAAYGGSLLTEPWNPHLPVLWWFAFLLAAWGVADADAPVLPVAVAAGSFCVQTHLPYGGVVGAVLLASVVAAVTTTVRRRDPGARRTLLVWGGVALVVGVLVWLPPLYEQVAEDRGNLTALWEHFSNPPEEAFGMDIAVHAVLDHLNVWNLVTRSGDVPPFAPANSIYPGLLLLTAWLASLVIARLRAPRLLPLHLVTGVALLAGTLSVSRIFGPPNSYLVLWLFGVTSLVVLAVVVTAVTVIGQLLEPRLDRRVVAAGTGALVAGLVVVTGLAASDAADTEPPRPELIAGFDAVIGPTVHALQQRGVTGGGPDGSYVVRVDDPGDGPTLTDGLVVALEREGLRAGVGPDGVIRARRSRVLAPGEATAELRLATGPGVDRWRRRPGYTEIASGDPRTPAQRRRYAALQRRAVEALRSAGLGDAADQVAAGEVDDVLGDTGLAAGVRTTLSEMAAMGKPMAVFVGPPEPSA